MKFFVNRPILFFESMIDFIRLNEKIVYLNIEIRRKRKSTL